MSYVQIMYRYAGEGWRTYGALTNGEEAYNLADACAKEYPTAMVGITVGFSEEDVRAKLDILYAETGKYAAPLVEAPRDVPLLEQGPGGDKDVPYRYAAPTSAVLAKWLVLAARVRRDEVGGPNDGEGVDA